ARRFGGGGTLDVVFTVIQDEFEIVFAVCGQRRVVGLGGVGVVGFVVAVAYAFEVGVGERRETVQAVGFRATGRHLGEVLGLVLIKDPVAPVVIAHLGEPAEHAARVIGIDDTGRSTAAVDGDGICPISHLPIT